MAKLKQITGFSTIKVLVLMLVLTVQATDYPDFPWDNIITGDQTYFTNTEYYQMYYEFMEGIQYSKLEYATQCRSHFSALMDDFYFLYVNHTTATLDQVGLEERIFNVTGIISGPYQETIQYCTYFSSSLQEKYLQQLSQFVDISDFIQSFMLNGLSTMYTIDSEILSMDDDALEGDWGNLAKTVGGVIRLLTNFDSIQARLDDDVYLQNEIYIPNKQEDEPVSSAKWYESETPLLEVEHDYTYRLMVAQEEYKFTFFTPVDIVFGFLQGGLYTLPKEDDLSKCGNDSSVARGYVNDMVGNWQSRNFEIFISNMAKALYMLNDTCNHCYFGAQARLAETTDTFNPFTILSNVGFNIGYIWTDLVMLTLAKPSNTNEDYFYFISFYTGDLVFRFFVTAETDENYWYAWALQDCADDDSC